MGGTGFADNRHIFEVFVVFLNCACGSVGNYRTQHVGHKISGLLRVDLLRIDFMLIDNFALRIYNLLDHIGVIKGSLVSDRGIGIR
ncbi:hypothetical protein D3C73_720860 [compost metagenome]